MEFEFNTHLSDAVFLIEILYAQRQMSEHYNTNT